MNDRIRRIYEMALQVLAFLIANTRDFNSIEIVQTYQSELQTATDALTALGANKQMHTAASLDSTIHRGDARDRLQDLMRDIAGDWRVMFAEVGGDPNKFRLPRGNNDQTWLAAARAYLAELPALKDRFIGRGYDNNFIDEFAAAIADFEQSIARAEAARGERVGTNAALEEPARTVRQTVEKLSPVIERRYRRDPQKLAEWLVASHVQRAPKRTDGAPHQGTPNG